MVNPFLQPKRSLKSASSRPARAAASRTRRAGASSFIHTFCAPVYRAARGTERVAVRPGAVPLCHSQLAWPREVAPLPNCARLLHAAGKAQASVQSSRARSERGTSHAAHVSTFRTEGTREMAPRRGISRWRTRAARKSRVDGLFSRRAATNGISALYGDGGGWRRSSRASTPRTMSSSIQTRTRTRTRT